MNIILSYTCKICNRSNLTITEVRLAYNGKIEKCKQCHSEYMKDYRNSNKEKLKVKRDNKKENLRSWHYKRKYNLTIENYNELLEIQFGGCAICKKASSIYLAVDHDHKTGKIRSLLCRKCNVIIGLLEEDENYVWDVLEYIKKFKVKE